MHDFYIPQDTSAIKLVFSTIYNQFLLLQKYCLNRLPVSGTKIQHNLKRQCITLIRLIKKELL